jgi:hypothetical protein
MHRIVDDVRENTPKAIGQKNICTNIWRAEGKMHRILDDVRENAPKPIGQKNKRTNI